MKNKMIFGITALALTLAPTLSFAAPQECQASCERCEEHSHQEEAKQSDNESGVSAAHQRMVERMTNRH